MCLRFGKKIPRFRYFRTVVRRLAQDLAPTRIPVENRKKAYNRMSIWLESEH